MRRNGYDSYHGRSRVRTFLKVLIVLLLVVLAVAVGALLWLEPYIDYSANGIKINLPFFQQKEPAPATGAPVVVTTPEPTPTPEPEEDFRGILHPIPPSMTAPPPSRWRRPAPPPLSLT